MTSAWPLTPIRASPRSAPPNAKWPAPPPNSCCATSSAPIFPKSPSKSWSAPTSSCAHQRPESPRHNNTEHTEAALSVWLLKGFERIWLMTNYLAPGEQITTTWLTAVLRQEGVLPHGEVVALDQQATDAFNSQTSHLVATYSADAPSNAPIRLVLKRNSRADGEDEIKFYNLVPSLIDHPRIIVPCYAAAYDAASGDSYLLLQDLSATHAPPVTRDQQISIVNGVPSSQAIEQVVDALAQLHAYWWEHPLLEAGIFDVGYWLRNTERFGLYLQRRVASWQNLISKETDWFPADLRELYEFVLARLPSHWERYLEPRFRTKAHITLTHNDAYFANFLCPKQPGAGAIYLLVWQSPGFEIAGYDLANLCATFWTSEHRRENHPAEQILPRYYAVFQARGFPAYTLEDLLSHDNI